MKKRRIGILTFHTAINYGAVLQAYALQQTLIKMFPDDEVKIIDFKTKEHVDAYKVFRRKKVSLLKNLLIQVLTFPRNVLLFKRRKRFLKFVENKLLTTQRISSKDQMLKSPPEFDIYISGSDQVFNPRNKYYKEYYLGFGKGSKRKVAYAPSCGISQFTVNEIQKINDLVLDFDVLSCRETSGAKMLSSIVKEEIPVVLDPVFLLTPDDWANVLRKPKYKRKYIFVYDLNGGVELLEIAKKIAKETGLKIICQTQKPLAFYKNTTMIFSSGPEDFLGLICGAEYVVTDSFHGTAFALLFQKPFYSYIALPNASSRIRSILEKLGLNEFLIEYNKGDEFKCIIKERNSYYDKMNDMRDESLLFLKNALNTQLHG